MHLPRIFAAIDFRGKQRQVSDYPRLQRLHKITSRHKIWRQGDAGRHAAAQALQLRTSASTGTFDRSNYLLATTGSIGYVSPDNVKPVNSKGPAAANIQSYYTFAHKTTPVYIAPTAAAATHAMSTAQPPSFTGGASAHAVNPLNWGVTEPLPSSQLAYPISGFSFIDLYSCYKSEATVAALTGKTGKVGYLTWYYGSSTINNATPAGILAQDGFAAVPATWSTAINTLLQSSTLGIGVAKSGARAGTKACTKISKGA